MPPHFEIVALSDEQLPELAELWRASWQETMPDIDFAARIGWFRQHVAGLVSGGAVGRIAVAGDGTELQGFLIVHPATGDLDQLAVSPMVKGKGVAQSLLAAARALCPDGLNLVVNAENPRALRFYERQGFKRTGLGTNPNSGRPTIALAWRPDGGD